MTESEKRIAGGRLLAFIVFIFAIWNWTQGHTIEAVLLFMYIQLVGIASHLKELYENNDNVLKQKALKAITKIAVEKAEKEGS